MLSHQENFDALVVETTMKKHAPLSEQDKPVVKCGPTGEKAATGGETKTGTITMLHLLFLLTLLARGSGSLLPRCFASYFLSP
jgi:hypothetical protein